MSRLREGLPLTPILIAPDASRRGGEAGGAVTRTRRGSVSRSADDSHAEVCPGCGLGRLECEALFNQVCTVCGAVTQASVFT